MAGRPPGRGRGGGRGRGRVKLEADAGVGSSAAAPSPAAPDSRKKFEPKVVPRRAKKLGEVKSEPVEADASQLQKLIQQAQDAATNRRGFRTGDTKAAVTRVAFGFGSGTSASARPLGGGFAKKSSSSGGGAGAGTGGGGGGGGGGGWRGPDKKPAITVESVPTGEPLVEEKVPKIRKGLLEQSDDSSYMPISLPLHRPIGVGSEFSDDEDDEDEPPPAEEEDAVPPAKELGLEAESIEDRLLFLQLPSLLPVGPGPISPASSLDKFPEGLMGKLRIYESGAIKLHLGEVVMNVYPGTRCIFSQEVVAINSNTKKCAFLGDVGQRLVVTPDIDGLIGGVT